MGGDVQRNSTRRDLTWGDPGGSALLPPAWPPGDPGHLGFAGEPGDPEQGRAGGAGARQGQRLGGVTGGVTTFALASPAQSAQGAPVACPSNWFAS